MFSKAFDEGVVHELSVNRIEPDPTGEALYTVKTSIDYDNACKALAKRCI